MALDPIAYFITWTTYGTWLPGDARGWRKARHGNQAPQPLLADWCRTQLKSEPFLLTVPKRKIVEQTCQRHCSIRAWHLYACNARSNHVHVVVAAPRVEPNTVRDQLKANATGSLRRESFLQSDMKIWAQGRDCEFIDDEDDLETVVQYVLEAQDRKGRDQS